jgi:hypothetical protein
MLKARPMATMITASTAVRRWQRSSTAWTDAGSDPLGAQAGSEKD